MKEGSVWKRDLSPKSNLIGKSNLTREMDLQREFDVSSFKENQPQTVVDLTDNKLSRELGFYERRNGAEEGSNLKEHGCKKKDLWAIRKDSSTWKESYKESLVEKRGKTSLKASNDFTGIKSLQMRDHSKTGIISKPETGAREIHSIERDFEKRDCFLFFKEKIRFSTGDDSKRGFHLKETGRDAKGEKGL